VSEQLEQSATEEVSPEISSGSGESVSEASAAEVAHPPLKQERKISWLRLAYCSVFLLAILAIFTFWSEVGGQGHLDLMPWYTKMICVLISAWCCVRLTASMVEEPSVWNRRAVVWLAGLILIAFTMAAITYYYHLHEETDQQDSDENTATAMTPKSPRMLRSLAE
jgi:fatty acid desaturase